MRYRQTEILLRRYAEDGDTGARAELVERFLPFARELATRYSHTDESLDDLFQVASIGLLKAIDRYDPERGSKFTSYAAPTIIGELKRYFRDNGWSMRVPRDLQERALRARFTIDALAGELGRSPSTREMAVELGWTSEEVLEALEAAASYRVGSLDEPVDQDGRRIGAVADFVGSEDDTYEKVEELDAIVRGWRVLPELERNVVHLRFFGELSQREIGDRLGYSQMHISRLVRRGLARLEAAATAERKAA